MIIGDIDGKGVVYYEGGDAIIKDNEQLIEKHTAKCFVAHKKNEKQLGYNMIFPQGEGAIYLTSKRFIFIREPVPALEIIDQCGIGVGSSAKYILKGRDVKKANAKEYAFFSYSEVKNIRKAFINSGIFLKTDEGLFWIGVDDQIMDAVERIMKEYSI